MANDTQAGTILLVDDDVNIRELAKRFLEAAGYTVDTASDGEEGIRFYEEHQPSIGLLLTDVTNAKHRWPRVGGSCSGDRFATADTLYVRRRLVRIPWAGVRRKTFSTR